MTSGKLQGVCGATGSSLEVNKQNINYSTWSYIYIYQTASAFEVGSFITRDK